MLNGDFGQGLSNWVQATYGDKPAVAVLDSLHGQMLRVYATKATDTAFGQDVRVTPGQVPEHVKPRREERRE